MKQLTSFIAIWVLTWLTTLRFVKSYSYTGCEYYNSTCLEIALKTKNSPIEANTCYGIRPCSSNNPTKCFVVWRNQSSLFDLPMFPQLQNYLHKSGFAVQIMGCFGLNEDCGQQSECVDRSTVPGEKDHAFCCCDGDLCNSKFSWVPKLPLIHAETNQQSNDIEPTEENSTSLLVIYCIVPVLFIAVVGTMVILLRKRKPARFGALTEQNVEESCSEIDNDTPIASQVVQQNLNIELLEMKSQGRFGVIWKGRFGSRFIAVKIFSLQDKSSWSAEQDVYNLPQMNHENIVKFISAEKRGCDLQTEFWLITSYLEKGSLCDYLKSNVLTWEEMIKVAFTIACGLDHLHEQSPQTPFHTMKPSIAHRDFKSTNVLLKPDMTACIAGFGLALVFEPGKLVGDAHGQVGTTRYMAPEVLEGAINFSRNAFLRIDMYACGLVLWELASRCSFILPNAAINNNINNNNNSQVMIPVDEYKLPFEANIPNPSLADMQDLVSIKKLRPFIKEAWCHHPDTATFIRTIEECWDHDAEARLSASCVAERIKLLIQNDTKTANKQHNGMNQDEDTLPPDMGPEANELTPLRAQLSNSGTSSTVEM